MLREEAMWDGPGVDAVRAALRELGRHRVVELREDGSGYLLDAHAVAPRYTLDEGIWTDEHLDWLAYASHEGTIAFGGVLAEALPRFWPHLTDQRWNGW